MKRTLLIVLLLAACVQGVMAQTVSPAHVAVYPLLDSPYSLLTDISNRLLPYQKAITATPLVDLLHWSDFSLDEDVDAAEPVLTDVPDEEADSVVVDTAVVDDTWGVDTAVVDSVASEDDYAAPVSARLPAADTAKVSALLALARSHELYDTLRYRILLAPDKEVEGMADLFVLDLQNPYAMPSVRFTEVNQMDDDEIGITLTRESAAAFAMLTYENCGNCLPILIDGKMVAAPRVMGVIDGGQLSVVCGDNVGDVPLLLRQLKAAVVREKPFAPLFQPQYVVGDTLTYRITFPEKTGETDYSHTFRLVPLVADDFLYRLEYIADTLFSPPLDAEDAVVIRPFVNEYLYQLRLNHFIIENDLSPYSPTVALRNEKGFSQAMEKTVLRYLAELKQQGVLPKESDEDNFIDVSEQVNGLVGALGDIFKVTRYAHPELSYMTAINGIFSSSQTAGKCYFRQADAIVDYSVSRSGDEMVVRLERHAQDDGPQKTYEYHIDAQGLVRMMVCGADDGQETVQEDFVIDRVKG
ncbi:MAG: hypothetical protein K6A82_09180 [Prevotella sp.]|nr:hypothetical protein [Prevotella sp.]